MIYNYPYFGFPNFNNYMNNNFKEPSPPSFNIPPYSNISNTHRNNFNTRVNNIKNINGNNCNNNFYNNIHNKNSQSINTNLKYKDPQKKNYYNFNQSNKASSKKENANDSSNDSTVINILGINLHFDDILLICLILFLNNENISDNYLILSLIMLLLG